MTAGAMVGTSHEAHVCVFEKGSDECIICGVNELNTLEMFEH